MSSQLKKDYVLGVDLGTTNVGITAIDDKFNIIKYKNQKEQQVNVFDKAQTAEKRRSFRSSRRNLNHKQARLKEFNSYIFPFLEKHGVNTKKLKQAYQYSFVSASDLALKHHRPDTNRLLANGTYKNFWFAINDLINDSFKGNDSERAKLIYECLYVLIKHRGNFLLNSSVETFEKGDNVLISLENLNEHLALLFNDAEGSQLNLNNLNKIIETNKNKERSIAEKRAQIISLLSLPELKGKAKTLNTNIAKAITNGGILRNSMKNAELRNLFGESAETFDSELKLKIDNSELYELQVADLEAVLNSTQTSVLHDLIDIANGIEYLNFVKPGKTFVESRLDDYFVFKKQLREYKNLEYYITNTNDKKKLKKLLTSYLFYDRTHNSKNPMLSYSQFTENVLKILNPYTKEKDFAQPKLLNHIIEQIHDNIFLVKTRSGLNASIPHQVYQAIMRNIIKIQSQYKGFEWLAYHKTSSKLFNDEKFDLERFIDFRIPYYIGPLTGTNKRESNHAWAVYKDNVPQKLSVFNLEEIIDLPKTANNFIKRQIGNDSRLLDEKVMPSSSLLYQEFNVLNEINMIKVKSSNKGWRKLTVSERDEVINSLFKTNKSVTTKKFAQFLNQKFPENFNFDLKQNTTNYISGLSDVKKFNNSMDTFVLFNKILGTNFEKKFTEKELLKITDILTVFDAQSLLLKSQELSKISNLTTQQVQKLAQQSLNGWGNLSYKMLTQITDKDNMSVIDYLRQNTGINLQMILAKKDFKEQIERHTEKVYAQFENNNDLIDFMIKNAYLSPTDKRAVKQALKQIQYTINFNNRLPKMIVIENARESSKTKTNNEPKLNRIKKLLEDAGEKELLKELKEFSSKNNSKQFGLREYLYFRQLGRNIYNAKEKLSLNNLGDYEIDHINPQSKNGKDNSLDNLVLTTHQLNQKKSNHHLVVINPTNQMFWKLLHDKNLISSYQLSQLNTNWDSPSTFFVSKFLKRSLVEINQINRIVLMILHQLYPNVTLIGLNSGIPHTLRTMFDLPKVREINYYHHGVDSFLTAFAGLYLWKLYPSLHSLLDYFDYNKLSSKTLKNINLKKFGFQSLINTDNPHVKNGTIINKNGEIIGKQKILQKLLINKNNPQHMRMYYVPTYDNLNDSYFNATKYGRNTPHNENKALSLKRGLNPKVYGYYQSVTTAYMKLVKLSKKRKGQNIYKFVPVPIIYINDKKALHRSISNWLNTEEYKIINHHVPLNATIKVGKDILRLSSPQNVFFTLQTHLHLKSLKILDNIEKASNEEINLVFKDIVHYIEQNKILLKYRTYFNKLLLNQNDFIKNNDLDLKKKELLGILKNLESNKSLYGYKIEKTKEFSAMNLKPMSLNCTSYNVKPIIF